jgi:hypothetical protein
MGPPTEENLKFQYKIIHLDTQATVLSRLLIEKEKLLNSKDKTISQLENEIFLLREKLEVLLCNQILVFRENIKNVIRFFKQVCFKCQYLSQQFNFQEYQNPVLSAPSAHDELGQNNVIQNENSANHDDGCQRDRMSMDDDNTIADDHDRSVIEANTKDNDNNSTFKTKKKKIELLTTPSTTFIDDTANEPPLSAGFSLQQPALLQQNFSDNSDPGGKPKRKSLIPFFSFGQPKVKSRKIIFSLLGNVEKKSSLFVPPVSYLHVNLISR